MKSRVRKPNNEIQHIIRKIEAVNFSVSRLKNIRHAEFIEVVVVGEKRYSSVYRNFDIVKFSEPKYMQLAVTAIESIEEPKLEGNYIINLTNDKTLIAVDMSDTILNFKESREILERKRKKNSIFKRSEII